MMCIIHLRVHCSDKFSELLVDDVEQTELTIESIVGSALLEVFDTVVIENVLIKPAVSQEGSEQVKEDR